MTEITFPRAVLRLVFGVLAMAGTATAAEIRFVTENYPPFNYLEQGEITGTSAAQIRTLMRDANISYTMEIMPWARALALAEIETDFCVFTAVHNAERDGKFKWIEPLARSRTLLIRRRGSSVAPKTLEEAKAFTIGTQRGDFTDDLLRKNNFPKVDLATDLNLGLKKLMSGRIDLIPISEKYYERLKRDGVAVESVLTLDDSTYAIACNRNVPDTVIGRMQQALDKLIADGTQRRLLESYGVSMDDSASR